MTDLEIQTKLLEYYEKWVPQMPKDSVSMAISFLTAMRLHFGVCHVASEIFNVMCDDWVEEQKQRGEYWGEVPCHCTTIEEITAALQLRIDILTKLVNQAQTI